MIYNVSAYAKINLFLEILNKRDDGYHTIESVFHTISLHDTISLTLTHSNTITVDCDLPDITENIEQNSAYKAARLFLDYFHIETGVAITIKKDIPVGGGLGGSSADAAGVIRALSMAYAIEPDEKFLKSASKIGADIPFLVHRGCAKVGGIGEDITPLPYVLDKPLVVAFPGFGVNTGWAYSALTFLLTEQKIPCNILLRCLEERDYGGIYANLYNRFETVVFDEHPQIRDLKEMFQKSGARAALMSGSGSSVFGVYDTTDQAYTGAEIMKRHCDWVRVVTPIGKDGRP